MSAFQQLPLAARWWIVTVGLCGAAAVIYAWSVGGAGPYRAPSDSPALVTASLLALAAIGGLLQVEVAERFGRLILGVPFLFVALLIGGGGMASTCAVVAGVTGSLAARSLAGVRRRPPAHRVIFNALALALAMAGASLVFATLRTSAAPRDPAFDLVPLLAAGLTFYLLDTGCVATAIALAQRRPLLSTWRENFLWAAPGFILPPVAALMAVTLLPEATAWSRLTGVLVLALAIWATSATLRIGSERLRATRELTDAVVTSLALAIDARDPCTNGHIRRVCYYATEAARRLGLPESEVEAVRIAAILHDIGKLGVPDQILRKPGKLTPGEYELVKRHVDIGAAILQPVPFEGPVVEIIRAHHERWDGGGYPLGLAGEAIPLGARIIAVVDVYDALTSERPYRAALPREEALRFLQEHAGSRFDPRVVATMLDLPPYPGEEERRQLAVAPPAAEEVPDFAYHEIARVNEELYALWEASRGLPAALDLEGVSRLILEKAESLVGFTAAAIFLREAEEPRLTAAHTVGIGWPGPVPLPIGVGPSGRAAAEGIVVANVPAAGDFAGEAGSAPAECTVAVAVPLRANGEVLGTLTCYHAYEQHFTPARIRRLRMLADHAGQAIAIAREFERTRRLALTDPHTGLPNARQLDRVLTQLLAERQPFSLVLLDCDGLQVINDRYGTLEGDRALLTVARWLQEETREPDLLARYGGDTFVLLLPGVGAEEAARVARRLQAFLDGTPGLTANGDRYTLGISIGVATFPADGEDPRTLIAVADRRMYANKALRRAGTAPFNRWVAPPENGSRSAPEPAATPDAAARP